MGYGGDGDWANRAAGDERRQSPRQRLQQQQQPRLQRPQTVVADGGAVVVVAVDDDADAAGDYKVLTGDGERPLLLPQPLVGRKLPI